MIDRSRFDNPGPLINSISDHIDALEIFQAAPVFPVVATANLVAAGAAMDGKIVIEDTGSGLKLVAYGAGLRKSVALT
jgi:hypothetical protein